MKDVFRREPAVLIGILLTLATGLAQLLADGGLTWQTAVPLICGAVTRFFVYAPANVNED